MQKWNTQKNTTTKPITKLLVCDIYISKDKEDDKTNQNTTGDRGFNR